MTPKNIISALNVTGTFPFNHDIFADEDYSTIFITDRYAPLQQIGSIAASNISVNPAPLQQEINISDSSTNGDHSASHIDLTNTLVILVKKYKSKPSPTVFILPEEILGLLKAAPRKLT